MIGFVNSEEEKKDTIPHYDFEEGKDMAVFGNGLVFPAIMENNNGNSIVLGTTGSGKTKSVVEPCICHSYNRSLVIPITKRRLVKQYTPLLKSRGYTVIDLNLARPARSEWGYDPMRTKHTEDQLLSLATAIVGTNSRTMTSDPDPFWASASSGACSSLMNLTRFIKGKKAGFLDFMKLYRSLEISYPNGHCRTNLDMKFNDMEYSLPDSQSPRLWRTISGTASRTASCVVSILNNALSTFCGDYGNDLFSPKKKMVDLVSIGKRKTAIFVTTSSVSVPCSRITNLFFADLFRELFEAAEDNDGHLDIPVHVLCDEFCTGSPIEGFAEHIAVFREAGVSCTILLQSLSQLDKLYGDYASAVIQENCDTLIFLGNNDLRTCREISERACLPLETVLNMKPGDEVFIRRGVGSKLAKRYAIFEDPIYISTMDNMEKE